MSEARWIITRDRGLHGGPWLLRDLKTLQEWRFRKQGDALDFVDALQESEGGNL